MTYVSNTDIAQYVMCMCVCVCVCVGGGGVPMQIYIACTTYTCIHCCLFFQITQHLGELQKVGYYLFMARCSSTQEGSFALMAGIGRLMCIDAQS